MIKSRDYNGGGGSRFLFLISLFLLLTLGFLGFVSSLQIQGTPVPQDTLYAGAFNFFDLGETWTEVVIGIIIVIIIAAALYDILGLTAFRSTPVRVIIGLGVALITSMLGLIRAIIAWAFAISGGIVGLGIAIVIIIAAVAFVLIHFGVSRLAASMIRARAEVDAAEAAAGAQRAGAALRGAGRGLTGRG